MNFLFRWNSVQSVMVELSKNKTKREEREKKTRRKTVRLLLCQKTRQQTSQRLCACERLCTTGNTLLNSVCCVKHSTPVHSTYTGTVHLSISFTVRACVRLVFVNVCLYYVFLMFWFFLLFNFFLFEAIYFHFHRISLALRSLVSIKWRVKQYWDIRAQAAHAVVCVCLRASDWCWYWCMTISRNRGNRATVTDWPAYRYGKQNLSTMSEDGDDSERKRIRYLPLTPITIHTTAACMRRTSIRYWSDTWFYTR